ncbi:RNA polymerase sigma factor YlaC [Luteitalea pratensis]|uniref:RNA polymerase sigma factor YlaC n=1 Tax=Luteitalea pratensis TaxID=1855912 RepID=A0A143PF06_LUTPR|nr:sigma-70 family RNA polymerase sigma factor [Luteitalea pratensis]AMY07026.1 RNA polymerase sigma factor YlaC [Luteitalea pratensis]
MPPLSPQIDPADRFEVLFREHYARVARVIGRIVRDQARAEEMAVDVFVKWRRHPAAHGDGAEGWLYRTAVRAALDAWRRERRWARLHRVLANVSGSPRTPEVLHEREREREQVHATLARLRRRDATALLLWSEDVPYEEIAAALTVRSSSVGSLLKRAQLTFRKEYEARYGTRS